MTGSRDGGIGVVSPHCLLQQSVGLPQRWHDGSSTVRPGRAQRGADRFHLAQGEPDICQRNGIRLQNQGEHVCHAVQPGGVDDGTTHPAPANGDETFSFEDAEGLPGRRLADPKLVDDLVLLGKLGAIRQAPVQNPFTQLVSQPLGETQRMW